MFHDSPWRTTTSVAIRDTQGVLDAALAQIGIAPAAKPSSTAADGPTPKAPQKKRIVAITACPTGIAHTFMAAEALKKAAASHGYDIKVETQGSVGAKNQLSAEDIAAADVVIIGADTHVDKPRFGGKAVYETSVGRALKETDKVMQKAFAVKPQGRGEPAAAGAQGQGQPGGETRRPLQASADGCVLHAAHRRRRWPHHRTVVHLRH